MDLFDIARKKNISHQAPLAERLKPTSLEDFVGQDHILGEGKLLSKAIKADKITSIIFYGPPGTGKTSLARIIAHHTKAHFEQLNAVTSGIKELKEVVKEAKDWMGMYGKKTILFVDEIHRFNKAQQDGLLPFVEDGTLVLIGATTENPFFEVNGALLSRSMTFELKPLNQHDIEKIIKRAMKDKENGLGMMSVEMDIDGLEFLSHMANGDARKALNTLELAACTTDQNAEGKVYINQKVLEACLQQKTVHYDKGKDQHYDVVSAFIKSMRGTDPDATLHYLARMLLGGEDPVFIARRIVIAASEDVGLADPNALIIANHAAQAVTFVGMPEARIILAQAAVYVATAPKSNASYVGINQAMEDVKKKDIGQVPSHIQDMTHQSLKNQHHKHILQYQYPHDYDKGYVHQQYMPDPLVGTQYYKPTDRGYESRIHKRLNDLKK